MEGGRGEDNGEDDDCGGIVEGGFGVEEYGEFGGNFNSAEDFEYGDDVCGGYESGEENKTDYEGGEEDAYCGEDEAGFDDGFEVASAYVHHGFKDEGWDDYADEESCSASFDELVVEALYLGDDGLGEVVDRSAYKF